MSSTNKTTNYELSQFLGTDKPAWLSDYNTDMSKIDTQMKANADAATAASGSATTANTAIGTLASLTTTAKTDLVSAINEVDSNADTAQGTASDAYTLASTASTGVSNVASYLNMTQFTDPVASATNVTITINDMHCAANAQGTLGKIYGRVHLSSSYNGTATISFATPLRPSSAITIQGGIVAAWQSRAIDDMPWVPIQPSYTIGTDGTCTISLSVNSPNDYRLLFVNSVIFAKDFGDTPTPE